MFKDVKKVVLLLVLVLVSFLAFACQTECPECKEINEENCKDVVKCPTIDKEACKDFIGPELNKDNCSEFCDTCPELNGETCKEYCDTCTELNPDTCKEYCETCPTCPEFNKDSCKEYCDTCTELNSDTCKEYCETCPEINEDSCKEFIPFVAPESFSILPDFVTEGTTLALFIDEEETVPANAFMGMIWTSSDEGIATVDENGNVTGVRPGTVTILATSVLNPEAFCEVEVVVKDKVEDEYDVAKRELAYIIGQIPTIINASYEFPVAWNTDALVEIKDGDNNIITRYEYPADLAADKKESFSITVDFNGKVQSGTVDIWVVRDLEDNPYSRVNIAVDTATNLLKEYQKAPVASDLYLPESIYGAALTWTSSLGSIIGTDGKYIRQNDDTPITLELMAKYGDANAQAQYNVTAKGYSNDEKVAYILEEGSLSHIANKEVSGSVVLPAYDNKFKAHLTYESLNPAIMDNTGKLVASVLESTEVEFKLTVEYQYVATYKFTAETTFKVTVLPETAASKAANKWLEESGFDQVVYFPYGTDKGNVLDVPTTYNYYGKDWEVTYDVEASKVAPKYLKDEEKAEDRLTNAFELTEDGKPKLAVQYLRYQQVELLATFKNGDEQATVALHLNIGASNNPIAIYAGSWTTNDQKDGFLSLEAGRYDLTGNVSHFDKDAGHVSRVYGWGFWSGYKFEAVQASGAPYESFIMDYMFWEVVNDGAGVKKMDHALFNNGGDMGGNWGWLLKNSSDKAIKIEVGTYAASGQTYADGTEVATLGSRLSYSMDGYALGFVADKDGNILAGSGNVKLQNALDPTKKAKVGEDPLLFGDSKPGAEVLYFEVPAGGYAMSWKYQFYSAEPAAVYPFCQTGSKINITKFGVHPLNSQLAEDALEYLVAAEGKIAEGGIKNNQAIEANLNKARNIYNVELDPTTKAEVFAEERLVAAEEAFAPMYDAEIAAVLAKENQELPEGETPFVTQLGQLYTRLEALSPEITALLTKKVDFDNKYNELSAIDLVVTLDYNNGYAKGLYSFEDFDIVIPMMLDDLYTFLVEKGAFKKSIVDGALVDDPEATVPTLEEFKAWSYWDTMKNLNVHLLDFYLFTPRVEKDGTKNENYRDLIADTDRFFNSEIGHKWIDIMNWVDEGTRAGNYGGQDAWGKKGEFYEDSVYLTSNGVTATYSGNPVEITNSGTNLGVYRFAQYITKSLGGKEYNGKIPADIYSAIYDRQNTQERFSKIVYHCTDSTVELPKAAYKEGAAFAGWYFEDGSEAVITGALFSNVTVYAKWNPVLEEKVAEVVGHEVTGVYYGATTDKNVYKSTTDTGTINDQVNSVGLGKYAVVVGDKMFTLPKFALIELGKDAEADVVIDSVEAARGFYGVGNAAQNSTGLQYDPVTDTAVGINSYGHGALYHNAGTFNVLFTDAGMAYGRATIKGENYGYDKFVFEFNAETKSYNAKYFGDKGELTLKPGDFLWCPMTAERYCTGLTNCNGTSGVKGCLADGIAVDIVDVSRFLPVDVAWNAVEFYDGETFVDGFYVEEGESFVTPEISKIGFNFNGWATKADAVAEEVVEVVNTPTESVTYYAVWTKLDKFDVVYVDPNGTGETTYSTFAEALNHINNNATINVAAGTYAEDIEITQPCTIVGPNNGVESRLYARKAEAEINGMITVKEGLKGVAIKGLSFVKPETTSITAKNVDDLEIAYNKWSLAFKPLIHLGNNASFTAKNANIHHNFFNLTAGKGGWGHRTVYTGNVENFKFNDNKVVFTLDYTQVAEFIYIYGKQTGTFEFKNNDILNYNAGSYCWIKFDQGVDGTVNFLNNKIDTVAGKVSHTILFNAVADNAVVNVIGNEFTGFTGKDIITASGNGKVVLKNNKFNDATVSFKIDSVLECANNFLPETITNNGASAVAANGAYPTKELKVTVEPKAYGTSVWSAGQNVDGNYIVNTTNHGAYWSKVGINLVDGKFVVACLFDGTPYDAYKNCDVRLTWYVADGYATKAASVSGIEVGQVVEFEGVDFAAGTVAADAKIKFYAVSEAAAEPGNQLFVDAAGAEDATHFKTIAAAVAAATEGAEIVVAAGTYDEALTINKSNITLVGANAETVVAHDATFDVAAATNTILTKELVLAEGANNVTVKGFVSNNQITLLGNENVVLSHIISADVTFDSAFDGSIRVKGNSTDLAIDNLFLLGRLANRGVHISNATGIIVTNFSITESQVNDAATGLVDFVRFGQANWAAAAGVVSMTKCYVRGTQAGLMVRFPSADKYLIEENVFDTVPAAVYMRSPASTDPIEYVCQYNTFNKCGDKTKDWDVVAFTTSSNTTLKCNYNAFINSFANGGTAVDYVIKVRTAAGTIDCSNNYFDIEAHKTENLNATGLTFLASADLCKKPA